MPERTWQAAGHVAFVAKGATKVDQNVQFAKHWILLAISPHENQIG
jgi:hypothetical protein